MKNYEAFVTDKFDGKKFLFKSRDFGCERYGVVLSFSQKRAFGAFPGTVDGATMFPVTPTPFYETDVPVPEILDCSD